MSNSIDSIDRFVGNKIKERRKILELSQSDLAKLLHLSYQQIQKYESGTNKVTVRRLLQLSKALNAPSSYFYEGIQLDDEAFGEDIADLVIRTDRTTPLNIMLVEDNASDEILIRDILENCDEELNLHSVRNSEDVMDYLFNHKIKYAKPRPDIIFLDIMLPKTSGLELLKEIRKNRSIADTPVIILSNSIKTEEMFEAYKYHASGFIHKSVDFEELAENLSTAVKYWGKAVVLPSM